MRIIETIGMYDELERKLNEVFVTYLINSLTD
jgi:hypothetical protein